MKMNKNIYSGGFYDSYMKGAQRDKPYTHEEVLSDISESETEYVAMRRELFMAGWARTETYGVAFDRIVNDMKYKVVRNRSRWDAVLIDMEIIDMVQKVFWNDTTITCSWEEFFCEMYWQPGRPVLAGTIMFHIAADMFPEVPYAYWVTYSRDVQLELEKKMEPMDINLR